MKRYLWGFMPILGDLKASVEREMIGNGRIYDILGLDWWT